jgi:hypothetical protein
VITRIEIDSVTEDCAFFFDDSSEPWSPLEFAGETEQKLLDIVDKIYCFNHRADREETREEWIKRIEPDMEPDDD